MKRFIALAALALAGALPARAQLPATPQNAIEVWLPHYYADPFQAWREHLAAPTNVRQRFSANVPPGGTPIGGLAIGKGSLLYDPAHHSAWYAIGCCSMTSSIAARVRPPPQPMHTSDLSGLRTTAGIALGDSRARVESIMGRAKAFPVAGHFGLLQLAYASLLPGSNGCGYFDNFVFERGKLIYIDLTQGC